MAADGVLAIALDRDAQQVDVDDVLRRAANDPDTRVVVLLVHEQAVIAGLTRNPSPEAGVSASAPASPIDPAAGDGCRVKPGMTADWDGSPNLGRILSNMPQPVVARASGTCDAAAVSILAACDIVFAAVDTRFALPGGETIDAAEAERGGLVTLSFPAADLERETQALARELAAKDPLALRFTKQTLRSVGALDWDEVLAFNAAKVAELQALRAGKPSPQDLAVQSFLAGKSKPGLGS